MYAFLVQDWVTVRSASGSAITQGEANWLDLSDFLDVVLFMETKNFAISSGVLYMAYQTSPTKDEALFQQMVDISTSASTTAIAVGVQTTVLLRDTALCPLARWFRWQLTPPTNAVGITSFEATFRIWISANQPGGYAQASAHHMGYGDSGGFGGPAWTQGPAIGPAAPSSGKKAPPLSAQQAQQSSSSGNTAPVTYAQGPSKTKGDDKISTLQTKPTDRLQFFRNPRHGNLVPYVSPGVKVTSLRKR